MERLQAYRYRLASTAEQASFFAGVAGCCRWVYNQALALREKTYAETGKTLTYVALCRHLTAWRAQHPWLAAAPVHPLQQAIKNLCEGYSRFFQGHSARPRFKKKGRSRASFRYPDPTQIAFVRYNRKWAGLKLPKVGWVKLRLSRSLVGEIRSITVSRDSTGHWSVSILTRRDVPAPPPHSGIGVTVGIDLGIAQSITTSDGKVIPVPQMTLGDERHRRRLARALSRTQKGSKNRETARARLARFDARWRGKRTHALHQASAALIRENQGIALEDLNVKGMTRRGKGKGRAAKAGLNRAILAQGWAELRRQLEYKGAWAGVAVVAVPPAYTSQRCARCGFTSTGNRTTQAAFACLRCGHTDHADVNAAINILAAGHAATARGGDIRPPPLLHRAGVAGAAPEVSPDTEKREPRKEASTAHLRLKPPPGIPVLQDREDVKLPVLSAADSI